MNNYWHFGDMFPVHVFLWFLKNNKDISFLDELNADKGVFNKNEFMKKAKGIIFDMFKGKKLENTKIIYETY